MASIRELQRAASLHVGVLVGAVDRRTSCDSNGSATVHTTVQQMTHMSPSSHGHGAVESPIDSEKLALRLCRVRTP